MPSGGVQESGHQGSDGGCHAADVHREDHGKAEHARAVERGSGKIPWAPAVEEPHDAFDNTDTGLPAGAGENPARAVFAHEPGVQIEGPASRGSGEKGGIHVVRSALEGLDGEPPLPEGAAEGHGGRGLAFP